MYFKNRNYYVAKVKYYLGLIATALLFDAMIILAILRA